jgi:glycosyltransferase involved in cell wall biosynthesis
VRVLYLTTASADRGSPQGRQGAVPLVLSAADLEVVCVDGLCRWRRDLARLMGKLLSRANGRRVAFDRARPLLRAYASAVEAAQRRYSADVVLVSESPIVALARLDVPVVTWTDAVFGGMVGYYPDFTGLSPGTVRRGDEAERSALHRAAAAVFLSEWAAEQARRLYQAPDERIHVIPFGGVLPALPSSAAVSESIRRRSTESEIGLVWMGGNWLRKGGDQAIEIGRILRERGHPVRLTLVGGPAQKNAAQLPWVKNLGALRRSSKKDRERLASLFLNSHVHLLPTVAECMGLGLAEASAHGVPSVATRTGGTPSCVVEGSTGFLIPEGSAAESYADAVEQIVSSPESFAGFAHRARRDYEERLSYPVVGQRIRELVEQVTSIPGA